MICSWVELTMSSPEPNRSRWRTRSPNRTGTCRRNGAMVPAGQRRAMHMTDDERAIRALIESWMTASQAGDVDTVLGLMSDDVVFMVPGREPFGKEAFANASRGMSGMRMEGKSEIRELKVLGDWAYLRNHI